MRNIYHNVWSDCLCTKLYIYIYIYIYIYENLLVNNFLNPLVPLPPLLFEEGAMMLWVRCQD